MKATIETKRLVLRNFQLSDAKSMFDSYCHSERITRYLTWYPHENVEATKEFITTIQLPHIEMNNALDLAITLKGEDQADWKYWIQSMIFCKKIMLRLDM